MIKGTVQHAAPGLHGFDVNQPISHDLAAAFKESYDFVLRYIPRTVAANVGAGNLTATEAQILLDSGLSLMCVQHVSKDNWQPSGGLGTEYGNYAGQYCRSIVTLPSGICVWLDLEMTAPESTAADVTAYCTNWFNEVTAAGYVPGLYVGFAPGLSEEQLYSALPFTHYFRGYNADGVATRGYQLIQHTQETLRGVAYDPSTTQNDNMGDSVIWLAPA